MDSEKAARLFISHHSSKIEVALQLEQALAKHDVKCWMAPRDVEPGEAFDMAIKKAIDESCGILLLFCSKSDKSRHVKRELILADSSHKAILPMRLEDIDPDDLAYHLANSQWIDWVERRDSTIERVAAKAHQLHKVDQKSMSVDDIIDRSGHSEAQKAVQSQPNNQSNIEDQLQPIEFADAPPTAKNFNWTLLVAVATLLVAVFAALLIWNNIGSDHPGQSENGQTAVKNDKPEETEPTETGKTLPPVTVPPVTETPPPIRPSFDCAKASQRIEFLICESPQLADLDRALASSYKRAMVAAGGDRALLRQDQRTWRTQSRDVCADTGCVARVTRERIAMLKAIAAGEFVDF